MKTVPVSAERKYQVEIGVDWKISLQDWIEGREKAVVICSEKFNVDTGLPTIQISDGEFGKNIQSISKIWHQLGNLGVSRGDLIIAIGGGTVTDVAGFAAATWMRGIDWIAIPTTLAGMVDASVGGKTGINSEHGKNLIGSFYSPSAVLIDLDWLSTLSSRDFAAGLAEVVKTGFIQDAKIISLLRNQTLQDVIKNRELQLELIHRSVSVKAEVVSSDFKESFLREILNYGHTLGHAIEKESGYQLRHGEAVAIGMCFAAELSKEVNNLDPAVVSEHYQILGNLHLPISYSLDAWPTINNLLLSDKKNRTGKLRFVGLESIGKCNRIENPSSELLASVYERISR